MYVLIAMMMQSENIHIIMKAKGLLERMNI